MALIKIRKNYERCVLLKDGKPVAHIDIAPLNPHMNCKIVVLADESYKISREKITEENAISSFAKKPS